MSTALWISLLAVAISLFAVVMVVKNKRKDK